LPLEFVTQNVCSPYENFLSGVKIGLTCLVRFTCDWLFLWVNISAKCLYRRPDRCCSRCYGTLHDDDDDDDDNNNNNIFVY